MPATGMPSCRATLRPSCSSINKRSAFSSRAKAMAAASPSSMGKEWSMRAGCLTSSQVGGERAQVFTVAGVRRYAQFGEHLRRNENPAVKNGQNVLGLDLDQVIQR